jgi:RNA polymerase-interacting CarD/CdnL/TRCF family regulator
MVEETNSFSKGNWIVHCHYGIGQIKKIEKKKLDGQISRFYQVQTNESTYWLPVDRTDYERVRHIASERDIRRVINVLKNPPRKIKNDPKVRKAWIEEISTDHSITTLATIVRELHAWQKKKKLNASDQEILERNQKLLLQEWSLIKGISIEEARNNLINILNN